MTARLHLAYAGVRHAFTTRNEHVPDKSVLVELVDGPFSLLDGTWRSRRCAGPATSAPKACKIEFDLRYAFAQRRARGGREPGVRPHRQHLRRLVRQARRAGLWRALTRRAARRGGLQPGAGRGRAASSSSCRQARRCATRCARAGCCERHPEIDLRTTCACGVWGSVAAAGRTRCATATGSRSTGRCRSIRRRRGGCATGSQRERAAER